MRLSDKPLRIVAEVSLAQLKTGDYIIQDMIAVERKSAEDFIQSLLSERLFSQCARLRKSTFRPLLLLEGDPFQTLHQVDRRAVKGALLSVAASWQIPLIHSNDREDSTALLLMLANQTMQQSRWVPYNGHKSKRLKNQRLRFLQGLPTMGPVLAQRLFDHFGSIEAIIKADVNELRKVEGIGRKSSEKIREFVAKI